MKILFTGGGTGGHIFPIIAICRELRNISSGKELRFFYIGPRDEISSIFLVREGIKLKNILAGKIRRYFGIKSLFLNIVDVLFKIPIGLIQAFFYIFFLSPDFIFSKGGYGSLPAVICGWLLGTPIFLHESDVIPGLANRFLSRFAVEIFVSFPFQKTEHFPPPKKISVGNPIRQEILEGSKEEAKTLFNLSGEKPVVLILGGSQGSQRINDVLLQILPELLTDFETIHQCGGKNFKEVEAESKVVIGEENKFSSSPFATARVTEDLKKYYHLFPFLDEIELSHAYSVANLIVSRAGSGSIFEISAVSKPSILIPLPEAAQNHQVENAYAYAKNSACLIIEEINLAPHFFLDRLRYLFSHPSEMEKMAKSAREFSRPRAAEVIASYIFEYLKL